MRLLTRRIYRAFPELDRYSDEQCDRFVRAARRAFWPRVGRVLVRGVGLLAWYALVVGILWATFGSNFVEQALLAHGVGRTALVGLGAVVVLFVVPLIGWLLWRDVQLRRRIKRILRARALCPGCGYGLVGLFVTAEHKVKCPECAMETEVDPSLRELTTDDAGRARFNPAPAPPTRWQRVMTPRRRKWVRRSLIGAAIALPIVVASAWGGYEWFLRRQAKVASAERPGAAAWQGLIDKRQPPGTTAESPNALTTLDSAIALQSKVQGTVWSKGLPTTAAGRAVMVDSSYIYSANDRRDVPDDELELERLTRAVALRTMQGWEEAGLFTLLSQMAAEPRAAQTVTLGPGQTLSMLTMPYLGPSRSLARACAARMRLAQEAGDDKMYLESFEQLMALARVTGQQPTTIDQLVSIAIEAMAVSRLQNGLVRQPNDAWVSGVEAILDRQLPRQRGSMYEGERLSMLDTTGFVFSDPNNVRWGRFSKGVQSMGFFGSVSAGRLGTYAENRDDINEMFDRVEKLAGIERFERPPVRDEDSSLLIIRMTMPAMSKAMSSRDQVELSRRGLRVQLALERFRNAQRRYPESLAELESKLGVKLPVDPYTGGALRYKPLDAAADRDGRGYLLYSMGADKVDDGGIESPNKYGALLDPRVTTSAVTGDFVLNTPTKQPQLTGLPDVSTPPPSKTTEEDGDEVAEDER